MTATRWSRTFWLMLLFVAACVVQATVFWVIVTKRRAILARLNVDVPDVTVHRLVGDMPRGTRAAAASSLVVSLLFFVLFWCAPLAVAPALGAVTVLLIAAANTVFFGSLGVFVGRWRRLPVITLSFLAA